MDWHLFAGFAFGFVIATLTVPAGVSGAVFMLPVQLSVLGVPSPSVTPTNLLYNVVSVPGALAGYRRSAGLWTHLSRLLLIGTVPGVVCGAIIRVYLLPNGTLFELLVAVFLLPVGVWLLIRDRHPSRQRTPRSRPSMVMALGLGAGLVGGIYGIGGGSLLAPVLAASGYLLTEVAPAALLSTFVTSCVGLATFAVLTVTGRHGAGPHWLLGITCGAGGLVGGYVGAGLQPHMPQRALRILIGVLAVALSVAYAVTAAIS